MLKANNKLSALKYLVILGVVFWSLPTLADETASSTPEIVTSTPSPETEGTTPVPSSTLTLRYEDQIIWTGIVNLTTTSYTDKINSSTYELNSSTVFSTLVLADQQSDAFSISDAQYNAGFNSFYLACINISSTSSQNACYNWNYVVNNNYPSVGMDKYLLNGGENIYVYFSNPWKITATTTTFPLNTTTTLQTWRYQFDNLAEPWVLDPNHLVEISIPNPTPTGWWDQTITVTTTQTNASGTVDYQFTTTGTYFAKIVSLDWTKWSNPITLSVHEVSTTTQTNTSTSEQPPSGGSGGSGSAPAISTAEINNAVQKILNFLKSKQLSTGAIVDLQMSDWSAMSFGANGTYAQDVRTSTFSLYDYLNVTIVTSTTDTLNKCTEYSRHILGLLASGFTKTNTQIIDIKNKITTQCLVGGQVGQAGINDDIFILLALLATDENASNEIVQVSVNAIKADQQENGAFTWNGWAGQDVTGAAVNALKYASTFGILVDDIIFQKAKTYLHNTQLTDGGWGFDTTSDPLTTSWAMYGINALGESQNQWVNSNNQNPWTLLANKLNNGGYYETPWSTDGIDWFATKHAVPALLGKSWPIILSPITPVSPGSSGGSGSGTLSTSTEVASIITTTTAPTSTILTPAGTLGVATRIEQDDIGEVLGMKIENEPTSTKTANQNIIKPKITIKTTENLEPTTTLSTENNQTNEQTKSNQEENSAESSVREWIKKLLALCLLLASTIGIYIGFKSFKQ